MTHEEIQILISAYFDGEVTPSEKNIVEEHLSTCQSCQKDYKSYQAMSSSLSKWSNETLSPDEEINVQKRIEQRREPMFTKRNATIFVTTLCLTLVIGSVVLPHLQKGIPEVPYAATDKKGAQAMNVRSFMPFAMYRGVQGNLKSSADDIGDQYAEGGNARARSGTHSSNQYEPYYMSSNYDVGSGAVQTKRLGEGLVAVDYNVNRGFAAPTAAAQQKPEASVREGISNTYYQNADASSSYYALNDEERKKIQKADINILVDNAFKTKAQLTDLILQFNGIIVSTEFNRSTDGSGHGTMVCKVYPKDLEHALQEIRKLGEVQNENESSTDVTDQYGDAQKNMDQYASDKEKLQKSLNNFKLFNPTTDEERANIQRHIDQTEEELKALDRVIKFYQDQTNMSLITVYFNDNHQNTVKTPDQNDQWKAMLKDKWNMTWETSLEVFSNILFGIIYLLSFVMPIMIWCGIFGLIYYLISLFFKK